MYYGQLANILVNPKLAPKSKRANDLPVHVKIDGFRLDHDGFLDENSKLSNHQYTNIQGLVTSTKRNLDAELTVNFDGIGKGLFNEARATTCDITGKDCYKARTVPSITSINLSTGYTTGG
jgi:hypothetical protein